jgi:hypothetical protein
MTEPPRKRPDRGPGAKMAADGIREAYDRATRVVDNLAPKPVRGVVKQIRKGPGRVLDAAEILTAKDKTRAIVGLLGGTAGAAGGAAMGAATGPAAPIAVPVAAGVGRVAGQHIAEEVYDDHADDVRRSIAATKAWIDRRNAELGRGLLQELEHMTRPPHLRRQF